MQPTLVHLLRSLAFTITLQAVAFAQAQPLPEDDYINPERPGIADGSNVVGAGRVQIETGLQHEYRKGNDGTVRALFVPTLVRLGVTSNLEARIEGNTYSLVKSADAAPGAGRSEGLAPVSIGFKVHIADADGARRPSVAAIVRVFPPSGSRGFRTTRAAGDFRLAADWDFAQQWSLNPNLGIAIVDDGMQGSYRAGLLAVTLSYNPRRDFNLFIDAGLQSPETRNGKTAVTLDVGAAWIVGRNLQFDLSGERGLPARRHRASSLPQASASASDRAARRRLKHQNLSHASSSGPSSCALSSSSDSSTKPSLLRYYPPPGARPLSCQLRRWKTCRSVAPSADRPTPQTRAFVSNAEHP